MFIRAFHAFYLRLLPLLMINTLSALAQHALSIEGIWIGKMQVGAAQQLTVAFELKADSASQLSAKMHSLDQNAYDIPVSEVNFTNNQVRLTLAVLNVVYEATLKDGSLEGQLTQGNNKPWPLNMQKTDKLPATRPNRPQEPAQPLAYREEDVQFQNVKAGVSLAGTLTYPVSGSNYRAVLLISGSGPNDRDQTIFGHKVFLVLSDYLTRAGFAVLRVDDRGTGKSSGDFSKASMQDLASDVVAGIDFLRSRPEIDPSAIGLIGHSLGADIAPVAAIQSGNVAFMVMMSGSAIPLYKGIYEQCRLHYRDLGISGNGIDINEKVLKAVFKTIRNEKDNDKAIRQIERKFSKLNARVANLPEQERKSLELNTPLAVSQFQSFFTPAMRVDLFYDPKTVLEKLTAPVLAINGSLDKQVHPHNLQRIADALKKAGNKNFEVKEFPGKNHLFQHTQTGSISEYSRLEETISPEVISYIIDWINKLKK